MALKPEDRATLGSRILSLGIKIVGGKSSKDDDGSGPLSSDDEDVLSVLIPKVEQLLGKKLSPEIASSVMHFWTFIEGLSEANMRKLQRHLGILEQLAVGRPEFIAVAYLIPINFTVPLSRVMESIPIETRHRDRLLKRLSDEVTHPRLSTMYAITPFSDLDENDLRNKFVMHHLNPPTLEELIAFVIAQKNTITHEPLIAIGREVTGDGSKKKRYLPTYAIHRSEEGRFFLEAPRRNFWLKRRAKETSSAKRPVRERFLAIQNTPVEDDQLKPPSTP